EGLSLYCTGAPGGGRQSRWAGRTTRAGRASRADCGGDREKRDKAGDSSKSGKSGDCWFLEASASVAANAAVAHPAFFSGGSADGDRSRVGGGPAIQSDSGAGGGVTPDGESAGRSHPERGDFSGREICGVCRPLRAFPASN